MKRLDFILDVVLSLSFGGLGLWLEVLGVIGLALDLGFCMSVWWNRDHSMR